MSAEQIHIQNLYDKISALEAERDAWKAKAEELAKGCKAAITQAGNWQEKAEKLAEALRSIGNEAGSPTMSYNAPVERQELQLCREKISKIAKEALAEYAEKA